MQGTGCHMVRKMKALKRIQAIRKRKTLESENPETVPLQ